MTKIVVNPRTWEEVKAEQKKLRLAFGKVLLIEKEQSAKSLRELGQEYGLSHVTVQTLIDEAQEVSAA